MTFKGKHDVCFLQATRTAGSKIMLDKLNVTLATRGANSFPKREAKGDDEQA